MIPSITSGNQKWNGAAPLFKSNEDIIIVFKYKEDSIFIWKLVLNFNNIKITEKIRMLEAIACVKKYFNDASVDVILWVLFIRGIKANKLISSPIQAPIHELEDIVINEPIITIDINKILEELLKIKKKRGRTFISGVWAQ